MEPGIETQSLRQEIERALRRAFDPADVLPRLARLARLAPPSSDDGVFAHRQLAELLVERHPWRAALYARRALEHRRDDDRAWAVLAFCQTLLGNFRSAAAAYRRAIACAPSNPWYAHNLGHLLDVALGEPTSALTWLRMAFGKKPDNSEIVASYAHALARAGHVDEARKVLEHGIERFASRELEAMMRWLEQGAPKRRRSSRPTSRPARPPNPSRSPRPSRPPSLAPEPPPRKSSRATPARLSRVLERGMKHLPFDAEQRARAVTLARDALPRETPGASTSGPKSTKRGDDLAGLAAAIAYAIVYIDHLPLSQAEVAAPFRVGVGRLRGRFAELRAELDLIRGDTRYASMRR